MGKLSNGDMSVTTARTFFDSALNEIATGVNTNQLSLYEYNNIAMFIQCFEEELLLEDKSSGFFEELTNRKLRG
jgi:hypothetical protein